MIRLKATTVLVHLVCWLLFLLLPLVFMTGNAEDTPYWTFLGSLTYWQFCLCYLTLFYLNSQWLFPRLYLQRRYVSYAALVGLLLLGVYFLQPFDQLLHENINPGLKEGQHGPARRSIVPLPRSFGSTPPPPFGSSGGQNPRSGPEDRFSKPPERSPDMPPNGPPDGPPGKSSPRQGRVVDVVSLFIFIIVMALSTATRSLQQWRETERRAAQAEAEKANTELQFLKAQINPHFLFNTLNNLYSLAVTGHEETADSILKLSKIMRYVTDEVAADFVPLANEVAYLQDYIDLQRLRLSRNTPVEFNVSGHLEGKVIAPLILMTFLENAFKHGISKQHPAPIRIDLTAEAQTIRFFCQNRIVASPNHTERNGIGLSNTKQRLAYLYPHRHTLHMTEGSDLYTVELALHVS